MSTRHAGADFYNGSKIVGSKIVPGDSSPDRQVSAGKENDRKPDTGPCRVWVFEIQEILRSDSIMFPACHDRELGHAGRNFFQQPKHDECCILFSGIIKNLIIYVLESVSFFFDDSDIGFFNYLIGKPLLIF